MSLEATSWALKETRLNKPCLRLMLILLKATESSFGWRVCIGAFLCVLFFTSYDFKGD